MGKVPLCVKQTEDQPESRAEMTDEESSDSLDSVCQDFVRHNIAYSPGE